MLANLTVSNFALIDNISIDFKNNLTVLTGETGAGKSLIIDAIGLLLGDRASIQMIRKGSAKAIVEGLFVDYNLKINEILDSIGIDINEDSSLIVKREINENGKSVSRINGSIVSLTQLESIASLLMDIHTQHDTKKLFDVRNYVDFLDDDDSHILLKEYQISRKEYFSLLKEYNKIKEQIESDLENLDYLKYRLNEIKSLNLVNGEIESLEEELKILDNYEFIYNNLSSIKLIFKNQDIVGSLYDVKNALQKLAQFDSKYNNIIAVVDNAYYDLEDIENTINNSFNSLDFDNDRLNEINDRINLLKNTTRKYKMSIEELICYKDELEEKINNTEQSDFLIEDIEKQVKKKYDELVNSCIKLTNYRRINADNLRKDIMMTLEDLCLPKVNFEIRFNDLDFNNINNSTIFKENGVDEVDFLVSFNVGEELKPLSKTASGGEMSRVMLAFKTHLLKNVKLSTIVFDEIDTGISGEVALAVANKIKEISKTTQVLSITHLPIVAAAADNHLFVYKEVVDERTVTNIRLTSLSERVNEIAKMISSKTDDASILLAKQMIDKF